MNSLDDPLDEQLRRQFQQVFDAYDVTPPDSLKDRIWRELPKAAFRRYVAYSLVLVGTLFPAGGRLFEQPSAQDPSNRQPASDLVEPVVIRRGEKLIATLRGDHGAETAVWEGAQKTPSPAQEATQRNTSLSKKLSRRVIIGINDQPPTESIGPMLVEASDERIEKLTGALESPEAGRPGNKLTTVSQDVTISGQESGLTNEPANVPSLAHDVKLNQQPLVVTENVNPSSTTLEPLTIRRVPTAELSLPINRRVAFAAAGAPTDVRMVPHRMVPHRVAPDWFVRVAALSTYQQMTVVGKAGVYVQHVGSPSALSGQTWGYQLSGGVSWRQWDAYVSYGQIRRWAYYDLATEDFEVKPTGSTDYQVTRRVESQSENVALPLLGVGISKQYTLGRRQQYYSRIGGQATYVPSTQQTLGWAQASWGLNLPLGKAHLVQVGPAIEYSLNRIWSTERQLIIHPYTVGISVTVRPQTFLTR
ncbi:hypothetical protein [Spirosoma pomorum]